MGLKTDLVEKRNELEAKQDKLGKVIKEAGDDLDMSKVTLLEGTSSEKVAKIRQMNEELEDLSKQVDDLVAAVKAVDDSGKFERQQEAQKGQGMQFPTKKSGEPLSLGEQFTKSGAYDDKGKVVLNKAVDLDIPLKTLMTSSAGWDPGNVRSGRVVDYATRPVQIIDIVPPGVTSGDAVVYMVESTFTNNAAEANEGLTSTNYFGEAALALTETTSTVRKIAVWLPVTDEQLADVPAIQAYINRRLPFMLRQRLDYQIINGDGSAPNLDGIINVSNVQTFARSGDVFDTLYEAAKKVRVTGRAMPNAMVIHPNDYQGIRTARTDDGLYILGNPDQPGPARIWGLFVVESDACPENSPVVGDFNNFIELTERQGIQIEATNSHDKFFIQGNVAIRATMRVALPVYRPAAFCYITSF